MAKKDKKEKNETLIGFSEYVKPGVQLMRPYHEGEDMEDISVSDTDIPETGGMIAINPDNLDDKWYIAKDFFNKNYVEKPELVPMPFDYDEEDTETVEDMALIKKSYFESIFTETLFATASSDRSLNKRELNNLILNATQIANAAVEALKPWEK